MTEPTQDPTSETTSEASATPALGAPKPTRAASYAAFQAFVFLGALLLFGMEPLVGKLLLPRTGGGFHAWATSLMFFQGALFLGYVYVHLVAERLGRAHLFLLALALPFLPIGAGLTELIVDPQDPVGGILVGLTLRIGVPFTLLATTGVIAQRWLLASELPQRENPYRLYAISNAGSLLALLAYPLLVEPLLGLSAQRLIWTLGFVAYAGLAMLVAPRRDEAALADLAPTEADPAPKEPPSRRTLLAWCLLSAAPSAFLMAVTNEIAATLGSFPLVWVLPLALYLTTFMLAFAHKPIYPTVFRFGWPLLLGLGLVHWAYGTSSVASLVIYLPLLFLLSLVAHGELYRSRPTDDEHMTAYYLAISLGGWLGGTFVVLLAPLLFDEIYEYPLMIVALGLTLAVSTRDALSAEWGQGPKWRRFAGTLSVVACAAALTHAYLRRPERGSLRFRNYYGIYRIADLREPLPGNPERAVRYMIHATTTHGIEVRTRLGHPVGYHHPNAPVGQGTLVRRQPGRLAVIGLGAGVLAAYARPGETLDFYEIDPFVESLARGHFTYMGRADERGVRQQVIPGDARLLLREAPDAHYDVIVVDAFSGGVIPAHLLTTEALSLYRQKLAPHGLIVFNISNGYYDLRPVLAAGAAALDPPLHAIFRRSLDARRLQEDELACEGFALAPTPQALEPLLLKGWTRASEGDLPALTPWTDDYTNPLAALWAKQR